ncbi:MAG: hypothetical protein AAF490_27880 [Chloroflexota bacterium]
MTFLTTVPVQSPVTNHISYLNRFIDHQLVHLDRIGQFIQSCEQTLTLKTHNTHLAQIQELYRRLDHEFKLAKEQSNQMSFEELMGDLIHFTAVSSEGLFSITGTFIQTCEFVQNQTQFVEHVETFYRLNCLNQAIFLAEQEPYVTQQTAVSLLHCLQKPNTINRPICIQISGTGARQSVIGHEAIIQTVFNLVFWVLAGKTPNNHVWVDSNLDDTAVYLQIWNDSLTIKPERLDAIKEVGRFTSIYQVDDFNGILLPLTAAQKLIQKCRGDLFITYSNPTVIEIVLPLRKIS